MLSQRSIWQSLLPLLMGLCLLLFSGCSLTKYYPPPDIQGEEVSNKESLELFNKLRSVDAEIGSLKTLARTVISDVDSKTLVRYAVVFQKPDNLRLEMLPLSGVYSLSLLVMRDGKAVLLDPGDNAAYTSENGSALLRQMLNVSVAERDLMSLFCARVPESLLDRVMAQGVPRVMHNRADSTWGIISAKRDVFVVLDERSLLIKEIQMRNIYDDSLSMKFSYQGRIQEQNINLPEKIVMELTQENIRLEFSLSSASLNQPIAEKLFEVDIPSSYSRHEK